MIITKLELVNFGIYKGKHEIDLTPKKKKPIILIGGLNGRGKTTLIDAFQLVLYGKFAKCSNRGRLAYSDYLKECINRDVSTKDGARLRLSFQLRKNRELVEYSVTRTWGGAGSKISESVEVKVNDVHDPMLSSTWNQFIQELIPVEISEFLFFDGEKIERLAEASESQDLIAAGVKRLLGVDLISRLDDDINYLPRRMVNKNKAKSTVKFEKLTKLVSGLELERKNQLNLIGSKQVELDKVKLDLAKHRKAFEDSGGDLFARQDRLKEEFVLRSQELEMLINEQIAYAEGIAPLCNIKSLITDLLTDAQTAKQIKNQQQYHAHDQDRDVTILALVEKSVLDSDEVSLFNDILIKTRKNVSSSGDEVSYLEGLDLDTLTNFDLGLLTDTQKEIRSLNKRVAKAKEIVELIERQLAALPESEEMSLLQESLTNSETRRAELQIEIDLLRGQRTKTQEHLVQESERLLEVSRDEAKELAQEQLELKMLGHIPLLSATLSAFREELVSKSIHKLEGRILECFDLLLGKTNLISALQIDASKYAVTIFDKSGDPLPAERLSAGERQLLAIAFIWGLASSANAPLPTIIDTPLGRLDSVHRSILLTRYFPSAAAQVILLSTDEEIDSDAYRKIQPYISKEYALIYDHEYGHSKIEEGYGVILQKEAAA